jgi:hypothetical protein
MDLDAGHSDDGAHFSGSKLLRRYVINAHFRAFGIALIRCIYSKPQTEERWRWQSTSGFLSSSPKFRLQPHYCTLAITKLLAVKNCAWVVGGVKAPLVASIE